MSHYPDSEPHKRQGQDTGLLQDQEVVSREIESLKAEIAKMENAEPQKKNQFPTVAFPEPVRKIISSLQKDMNFPPEFTGCALLFAAAIAIGNSLAVRVNGTWIERAILYLALIGRSGSMKTPTINFALKPFNDRDSAANAEFRQKQKEFQAAKRSGPPDIEPPQRKQCIVRDATPEALISVHQRNLRGIGLHSDELYGHIGNYNRYNAGSDQEFWLSNWSGSPISVDRKTGDSYYIRNPYISVIGGLQQSVLPKLAANGRDFNGFLDRYLFASRQDLQKPELLPHTDLDSNVSGQWAEIIGRLLSIEPEKALPDSFEPQILEMSSAARKLFETWYASNAQESNKADDMEASIRAKMDSIVPRLALILEALSHATGAAGPGSGNLMNLREVGDESMKGAIHLSGHFLIQALKVREILTRNPVDALPENQRKFYKALPDSFETATALAHGDSLGIDRSTVYRYLTNKTIFKRETQGWYLKLYPN